VSEACPAEHVSIAVSAQTTVSARLQRPSAARACYVLAHGAGAGMKHPAMRAIASGLGARQIATLRYQFPYMERGSRRPDPPPLCHATVRAAVARAAQLAPALPLFAGGRSFGGRMTSQAQALEPLPGVRGLAFFAFPLHPAGRPADSRAAHLLEIDIPMLFLQGSRDALAAQELLVPLVERLGARASLELVPEADHSFHVPRSSGRTDAAVLEALLERLAAWMEQVA
jgi:uncharacterized protein